MTLTKKSALAAVAAQIIGATTAGSNTKTIVGGLLRDTLDSAVLAAPDLTFWVDPDGGDDSNDGLLEGTAHQTFQHIEAQCRFIIPGKVIRVYLLETEDAEGIDDESFWRLVGTAPAGLLEIVGVGENRVAGPFTLTAYDSTQNYLTFGSPGWTPKAWSGYDLKCLTSPLTALQGVLRTILYNDSTTTMTENVWQIDDEGTWQGPAPVGSTFEVSEQAVKIKTAPLTSGNYWDEQDRVIVGGQGRFATYWGSGGIPTGLLRLINLEFRVPDGEDRGPVFTGHIDMYGVSVTSNNSGGCEVFFVNSHFAAGTRQGDGVGKSRHYGRGFSTRTRDYDTNPRRPRCRFIGSTAKWHTVLSTGPIFAERSTLKLGTGGTMADMDGWNVGYPHAAIHVAEGSWVSTGSDSGNAIFFVYSPAGAYDFEVEGGRAEIYVSPQHVGQGTFARARAQGHIVFGGGAAPRTWDGNGGTENVGATLTAGLRAHNGGSIRLIGWDGSAAVDLVVGQNVQVSRDLVSNPFSTTDADGKEESEGSFIMRTG